LIFFHDKLVITPRHIWQTEEKWSFYNALNKHLLVEQLPYCTGLGTVEVYWCMYCKLHLSDYFIYYAMLHFILFPFCFHSPESLESLVSDSWNIHDLEKKEIIVARIPPVFWSCILDYLLYFISFFYHDFSAR
jgi:hypothetical protein